MALTIATALVYALAAWCAVGLVVGVAFVFAGAARLDPAARDGTLGFRLLILPGCVALWPWVLRRWHQGHTSPPTECTAHRRVAARHSAS